MRGTLVQLLPPVHRLDDVANRLLTGQMAATNDVLWLVGYGVVFFALGLVVITRRSLVD
jgi:ABC-type transport system involved in multi-copper enzyme maturation permease subunit